MSAGGITRWLPTALVIAVALLAGYFLAVRGSQNSLRASEQQLEQAQRDLEGATGVGESRSAEAARRAQREQTPEEIREIIIRSAAEIGVEVKEINQSARIDIEVLGSAEEILDFAQELGSGMKIRNGELQASGPALLVISANSRSLPRATVTAIPASHLR